MKTRIIKKRDRYYVESTMFGFWISGILSACDGELHPFSSLEEAEKARDKFFGEESKTIVVS